MDFREQDLLKTAEEIQHGWNMGNFEVKKIEKVIHTGSPAIVRTDDGEEYFFDNHPYNRMGDESPIMYIASNEEGIYAKCPYRDGRYLVIFDPILPQLKVGDYIRGYTISPDDGRLGGGRSSDLEGYVSEITPRGFILHNSKGKLLGIINHG